MKRLLLILVALTIVVPAIGADEATEALNIVYVDVEEVLEKYKRYQESKVDADTQIQEIFRTRQQELDTLQQQIATLEQQLSGEISDATRSELTNEYTMKVNQALKLKDQAYVDADKKRAELLRPVVENVNKAIQEMSLVEDYDFVLDLRKSCLYVADKEELNITKQLIDKLNSQY